MLYKSSKSQCLSAWLYVSSYTLFFEDLCLPMCDTVRVITDIRTRLILDVSAVPD